MRQTFSIITGLLLCISLQAKNKVIEQPVFCVRNTTSIEVSKVELSDTATVLHVYAKYRPKNWIKISPESYLKDNNGETYLLRSGIGIIPGKEFWMPESGEAEFRLVFPPLPDGVTSIDFTEGEKVDNAFSIWGIQLKGKKLPALALPETAVTHIVDPNAELPEPVVQYGKGILKGKLLDYRIGMLSRPAVLVLWESLKADVTEVPVTVNSDGSFCQEVMLGGTTTCSMNIPGSNKKLTFFMEPGKETELYANLRELSRQQSKYHCDGKSYGDDIYLNGPLATVAQELYRDVDMPNLEKLVFQNLTKVGGMDFGGFKSYVLQQADSLGQEIGRLPVSKATRQLLGINNKIYIGILLRMAPSVLTSAAIKAGTIKREEGNQHYKQLTQQYPSDYMDDIDMSFLNTPRSILADMYYYPAGAYLQDTDKFAKAWGTDKGIFFDIAKAVPLYQNIKNFSPLTPEEEAIVATLPDAHQKMVTYANNELLAKIEANKKKTGFTVNEVGEVSNEDLFVSIISKFRGKVILVDFWATWCGPCRMANKQMIPMKEELKDKDIVYLYLTGETSPLKTWENMIPDIHGEHYRLTGAQWEYLSKSFEIRGVPTYMIIDREGNTKYRTTGFPGAQTMKEELLKVIG